MKQNFKFDLNTTCDINKLLDLFKEGKFCVDLLHKNLLNDSNKELDENIKMAFNFLNNLFDEEKLFFSTFNFLWKKYSELEELNKISLVERNFLIDELSKTKINNSKITEQINLQNSNSSINILHNKANWIINKLNLADEFNLRNETKENINNDKFLELENRLNFIMTKLEDFDINISYENPNLIIFLKSILLIINSTDVLIKKDNISEIKQNQINVYQNFKKDYLNKLEEDMKSSYILFRDHYKNIKD